MATEMAGSPLRGRENDAHRRLAAAAPHAAPQAVPRNADGSTIWGSAGDGAVYTHQYEKIPSYTSRGYSSVVPSADGTTAYFGAYDGHIYALNAADGKLKWRWEMGVGDYGRIGATPRLSQDGTVLFFGGMDGCIYAIATTAALYEGVPCAPAVPNPFLGVPDGFVSTESGFAGSE